MLNIARNASIDTLRSKSYQNSQKNQELPENVYKGASNQTTQQNIDNIGLKKVLEKLKPEHRVLVELAYFKGFTHEEIAEMMTIPLGNGQDQDPKCVITIKRISKVNLKEYIASGIIESYVMGLASESERAEFEQMCAQYPELVAERRKFEESLEAYASEQAMRPPLEVKAKVLKAINTMENSKSPRSIGLLRFVAAAAVILLVGMVVLYYQANQQNKDLANTNKSLAERLDKSEATLNKLMGEIVPTRVPQSSIWSGRRSRLAPLQMSIGIPLTPASTS